MKEDFLKLISYLKRIESRYFHALSAFYVYEALCQLTAPNITGEIEAKENSKIMSDFNYFFVPAKESLRVYFLLELAKLFDASRQSLQINKIVGFTAAKISSLSVDDFAEHNKDRQLVEELIRDYRGIAREDLAMINLILYSHGPLVEKLITYRDKWLAHDDVNKPKPPYISQHEVVDLFEDFAEVMRLFSSPLNRSFSIWDHVEENAKHHTRTVVEHLRRFEPYRLKEIEDELI